MGVDVEVANGSSQPTAGNKNCIKVSIIGIVVIVLGLTTVLVCLRFSKRSLPAKRVDSMSSEDLLNSKLKDDFPINEADVLDKVDIIVEEVEENLDLVEPLIKVQESEESIEILKEVLGNMKGFISNAIEDTRELFIDTEVLENELPTPRMIDLRRTNSRLNTGTEEVFDDYTDLNVPEALLGEDSEEMSEHPTLEEISTIVKKIIESYKEKDDNADVNQFVSADGTSSFPGEVDGSENIVNEDWNNFGEPSDQVFRQSHDQIHPITVPATHTIHDQTNSNHEEHFELSGHRGDGSQLKDKIGDHVFPIRSEDIHDDFAQLRGMGRDDTNRHLNSRFPNSLTHSDIPQNKSHNSSVPLQDRNFLIETLADTYDFIKDVIETTSKAVAITTPPSETNNKAVATVSPPSETTIKAFATVSPPSETTNKAGAIEPLPSETIGKAFATVSSPSETTNKGVATVSPPSESTKKAFATVSSPSETTNTAFAIEPRETVETAGAIEPLPSETTNKAVAIEYPPSETTSTAVAIEPSLNETVDKAVAIKQLPNETNTKAVETVSPPSETTNTSVATEPSFSETVDKTVAIEQLPSETTNTAVAIEPLLRETVDKAIESPPIETTNKPVAIYSPSQKPFLVHVVGVIGDTLL